MDQRSINDDDVSSHPWTHFENFIFLFFFYFKKKSKNYFYLILKTYSHNEQIKKYFNLIDNLWNCTLNVGNSLKVIKQHQTQALDSAERRYVATSSSSASTSHQYSCGFISCQFIFVDAKQQIDSLRLAGHESINSGYS